MERGLRCEHCGKPVTRRLTGGLAVFHGADISYALVAGEKDWPYLYDQEQSYARVHALLGEALRSLGENVEYHLPADLPAPKAEAPRSAVARSNSPAGSLCVNTFFPHDVRIGEKKIIGSCQRRRGKVLLQQGSLHHAVKGGLATFAEQVAKTGIEQLGIAFSIEGPRPDEQSAMRELLLSRYGTAAWNGKF
jgi:lipoate-protein ligase A